MTPPRIRIVLACAALAAGCASARIVRPPNSMRIVNLGRLDVAALMTKPCGASESAFTRVASSAIARDGAYTLPLIDACIDLIAVAADDRVLGRQANLRMLPGSSWIIR